MNRTVSPGGRTGRVRIPASKSQAHRLLICAAVGSAPCTIRCEGISRDIAATAACLAALGAQVHREADCLCLTPLSPAPSGGVRTLRCGESGSTLRFLLPLTGALGVPAVFLREGRLAQRPLAPLDQVLQGHGMQLREEGPALFCSGTLRPGAYSLPGNISSQYISGLLMALPLLAGDSTLHITGEVESGPYITLTEDALALAGVHVEKEGAFYRIPGGQRYALPPVCQVEGDYSSAAFFLCAGAFSQAGIRVEGLRADSAQGDRAVVELLRRFGAQVEEDGQSITVRRGQLRALEIDASAIPDLVPVLCVLAAVAEGESRIVRAGRLRLKESDRLQSTCQMLLALGADIRQRQDGLVLRGRPFLEGGTIDPCNDHRIAMAAAVAACAARGIVTIQHSACVEKSYPAFWQDFSALKGE